MNVKINEASLGDVKSIAVMVGELLEEISAALGVSAFNFNQDETEARLQTWLNAGIYKIFVAKQDESLIGFITLTETRSLYAEGTFAIIPEFYVRPEYRSMRVGKSLLQHAKEYGSKLGWKRLEVTPPPLPHFERTIKFYERESFTMTGARKMKCAL